ncbi:unnamed protein product [Prorocentrum cordatum]|uniref:Ankyrin repeat domain-containing protein n=1 Tax=Prorocentrum cordatum TaxID=2364126 RepID=A0ABN9R6V6_9DINO|nr:unnamed protein product [Polarella glacialis]|mmetsp:Transcript_61268/g.165317  ORF Transcript_61268/g.165317 Transcript_61268/m.165317 type:complete len:224 (+) Transcript_61268:2-673(+)
MARLAAPEGLWESHWKAPADAVAADSLARSLLPGSGDPGSMDAPPWEPLLDALFVLTARGRASVGSLGPVHNLLDLAVERGLGPLIPLLRARGYELELLDAYSLEALVQEDRVDEVRAYLEAGICPDIRANAGRSMLMVATAFRCTRVVPLLLRWGADPSQRSGFGQWTALMWAAHVGWEHGCRLLLEHKACAEDRNSQGLSALDIARSNGHAEAQRLLAPAL